MIEIEVPLVLSERVSKPVSESTLTALQWLIAVHRFGAGRFWSKETPKEPASNSELRRWINNGSLHINGGGVTAHDVLNYPIVSAVLFPKNAKSRITII